MPTEKNVPVTPPEREAPLVFVPAGRQDYHISDFYEAEAHILIDTVKDAITPDEGDVYVYKLVPYAILEGIPAQYKVKE